MANTNLPQPIINDSAQSTKLFFEQYGQQTFQFTANEIESTVAFFRKKGFGEDASVSTALAILKQARFENSTVFSVLDTLEGLTDLQLSAIVAEILNNSRKPISVLGYRQGSLSKLEAERNIAA
jgi:hypothetical protein